MPRQTEAGPGLILLFVGEVGASQTIEASDERNQTGILTSGLNLASAFPAGS